MKILADQSESNEFADDQEDPEEEITIEDDDIEKSVIPVGQTQGLEEPPEQYKKKKSSMSKTEQDAVNKYIDILWDKYDTDKSNDLDKEEFKFFMQDLIGFQFTDPSTINEMFDQVDVDGSGCIDRDEMKIFVSHLLENKAES